MKCAAVQKSTLLTRFTVAFVATILIPSLAALTYSVVETSTAARRNALLTSQGVAKEVFRSVSDRIVAGEELGTQLSLDTTLRDYLRTDFVESAEGVTRFLYRVRPIVDYAIRFKGEGIDGARVVFAGHTLPESFPYFVSEERMRALPWFREFQQSERIEHYVFPSVSGVYSPYLTDPAVARRPVYTYVRKIVDVTGAHLGTTIVDVPVDYAHEAMNAGDYAALDFAIFAESGYWVDSTMIRPRRSEGTVEEQPPSVSDEERRTWTAATSDGDMSEPHIDSSFAYFHEVIGSTGLVVSARVDLRGTSFDAASSRLLVGIVIILGTVALEVVTYVLLSRTLYRLRGMLTVMNLVADGELGRRVPVESDDEIGRIAVDFNLLIAKINDLVRESVERETLRKDTELKALQFQINPHFIYNTIDTFRMRLLLCGQDELADDMADFGKLIRYHIAGGATPYASLADELRLVDRYVRIQRMRYGKRLTLSVDVDALPEDTKVLRFLLQPLVENSIRHGMPEHDDTPLAVKIAGRRSDGMVHLSVSDDGVGMDDRRITEVRQLISDPSRLQDVDGENRIGISNIAHRLAIYYAGKGQIELHSRPDEGTVVDAVFPEEHP